VVVNIGGIANLTVLAADPTTPVLGFDTGPGNTLLDGWCRQVLGEPMDRDGALAARGRVLPKLLSALLGDSYFSQPAPKSTGPEYFTKAWLQRHLDAAGKLEDADVQATLVALTARTISDAIRGVRGLERPEVFVCGGGAHNPALMRALQECLPSVPIAATDALGVSVDWVEAMAFAWLARQRVCERPGNCVAVTGAKRAAVLGGLYRPE
jgi:anhydro-N-acetylmuramic acid kinase